MIKGADSTFAPGANSIAAAKADGVKIWGGYLPGPRIYNGWTAVQFDSVRVLGGVPIGYCSGWASPSDLKAMAANWNVRGCLDVESTIRGDGPWVQPWLDASGFGLYGNAPVHPGRRAAFHVLAAYPGHNPNATWDGSARPNTPCGWQYQGTHSAYGTSIDATWFDDWFAQQGEDMTDAQAQQLQDLWNRTTAFDTVAQRILDLTNAVAALTAKVDALPSSHGGSVSGSIPISGTLTIG